MSKGKRMQQKHVHVNKYASGSHAEGALDRIPIELAKEQAKRKREDERTRNSSMFGSTLSFVRSWGSQWYRLPEQEGTLSDYEPRSEYLGYN